MAGCRPHYFEDTFGENVECKRCGFIRHKTNIDLAIDFSKIVGLPMKPDTTTSWTTTTANDYKVTI